MSKKSYVLITPAKNEETYIEEAIKSVISQTILPRKWVIVSDGSIDCTEQIVSKYTAKHDFIRLLRISEKRRRNFRSKVDAINTGYKQLKHIDYEFIGNLDADVSFNSNYYESILEKFQRNARLGIAGGFIFERYNKRFKSRPSNSVRSVAGAVQLFRRECYEAIGGYFPIKIGGEDWYVEVIARKNGWQVEAFPEIRVFHHRHTGTSGGGIFQKCFREGLKDFSFGSHPLFEIFKCLRRVKEKPYVVGALLRMCGFIRAYYKGEKRVVSDEFVNYLRREQMHRLKKYFLYTKEL